MMMTLDAQQDKQSQRLTVSQTQNQGRIWNGREQLLLCYVTNSASTENLQPPELQDHVCCFSDLASGTSSQKSQQMKTTG